MVALGSGPPPLARLVRGSSAKCSRRRRLRRKTGLVHHSAAQLAPAGSLLSVNVGALRPNTAKATPTAIGKVPVAGPVLVRAPGCAKGESGLAGDAIGDKKNHGGDDQAVYAYAREDLDGWEAELGWPLPEGAFGENLTTVGVDPNGALIGERWKVGGEVVLQVTSPRIPCKTFATWLGETGWLRRFRSAGKPGAYLRVLRPGFVCPGDPVAVVHKPAHAVTVALAFRAFTTAPRLRAALLEAGEDLPEEMRENVLARQSDQARLPRPGDGAHGGSLRGRSGA